MAHNNIEIEIQVKVEHGGALQEFLEKNAKFISERRQIDTYFTPAHRNFIERRPVKEWLRLRNAEGAHSLNYKSFHYDENGKSLYCDEHETILQDGECVQNIFAALDFRPVATVDKVRKSWKYRDYEIAIDSVKDLGDFVEVEYCGSDVQADPKKIKSEMLAFLKEIGCGTLVRNVVGYPFQLLFPNEIELEQY